MRRFIGLVSTAVVLVACLGAQTPPESNEMTLPEFRQVLVDLGTYLDAHKGTTLASQFSSMPEESLAKIYPSVPNPAQLKNAVAALKEHDAAVASGTTAVPRLHSMAQSGSGATPMAVVGSCAPGSIIDNSPGSSCTPSYPDPTNTAWQNLVNPIITFNAFSPSDYASVSSQQCGLTVESNLVQVVAALNGTVTVAAIGCNGLDIVPVAGEVAAGFCNAAVAIVGVAGAVSQGLLADCSEQDGNVNSAEIDAGFHNTVTIFDALGNLQTQLAGVGTQIDNMLNTDNGGITTLLGGISTNLLNDTNSINNNLSSDTTSINSNIAAVNKVIVGGFSTDSTQLGNLSTAITNGFGTVNTALTNNNNQVTAEFVTIGAQLTNLVNQLQTQIASTTAALNADMRQTWKLLMTPDGEKVLDPAMLTCTGPDCPNVLAKCPAAGCSWNNVGPLP